MATDGSMAEKYEGMLIQVTDSNGTAGIDVSVSNVDASSDGDYGDRSGRMFEG